MRIHFPPELPVSGRRDDIAAAIRDHQVVVVAGETGSGKTTQLPKICLELGLGREGMIGHTQPRRIAARSVAERIGAELGTGLGDDSPVGYQVRFTDRTSAATRVKVMTDGILLAELQRDRMLRRYEVLIIDEAHERSLNIDFLLGYLKQLLARRRDLKVVITSATIDPQRFAGHFAAPDGTPAPIIEVSGRTYPVEVRYRPLLALPGDDEDDEDGEPVQRDTTEAVVDAVAELSREGPGDVLVFLPGEREIRDTAEALTEAYAGGRLEVLPLYSRLSAAEQHRVFTPPQGNLTRRVVLATNVAETSLTVPGIRYVVDSGLARISRYSARTKVQRLPVEPISQASARQRSGRCGRVEAGIAIRLYAEEDHDARPAYTDPEILRTNLASVVLQMVSLGLGEVADFPFVEPPERRDVADGVQLLDELGALVTTKDGAQRLTRLGRRLARLPVDPRIGRMVLEAERLGCVREVIVIAAALSLQDPRERPTEQRPQADQAHARFRDETSDFLAWLNLWRHLRTQQRELSSSAFRRMCKREFLNYLRVREWQDFESQLRQVAKEMDVRLGPPGESAPDADAVHQALLSGLLSQVGLLEERERSAGGPGGRGAEKGRDRGRGPREYLGARGARFAIFPGSGLARRHPPFVMAGELVETGRLWGRQVAAVQPEWAERLGAHLVKRSYSEPAWSKKRGSVVARERVTLYGVPLVADRLVQYGKIDAALSRELFIRHALVHGEWHSRHRFLADNARLLEQAEELEHRARRRGIVVDEHTLYDFYDARVGAEVVSGAHFDTWWKRTRRERPDLLRFDPAMLTHEAAGSLVDDARQQYPDAWVSDGGLTFDLAYHFEPGAADDGVTVEVPVASLNRVAADDFSWHVPGLRHELVTALIRSLPKALRVNFVPAPQRASEFLAAVPAGDEPLLDALERHLRATTGVHVPRQAWGLESLPDHLRPTFRVVDDVGREAGRGKDLEALKVPLRERFDAAAAQVAHERTETGATSWTFGEIETSGVWARGGHEVEAHPGLTDEGASVGLGVWATADEARARHRLGVRRLLALAVPSPTADLLRGLSNADKLGLAASPYAGVGALLDDLSLAVLTDAVDEAGGAQVRDEAAYDALLAAARDGHAERVRAALPDVLRVLARWRACEKALGGRAEMAQLPALTDMREQLAGLVRPGFAGDAGIARLRRVAVYLAALAERRERLDVDLAGDRRLMEQVTPVAQAWRHQVEALPPGRPPGDDLRRAGWLLEEFRVSLWAQRLGTAEKVSDARIRKLLR